MKKYRADFFYRFQTVAVAMLLALLPCSLMRAEGPSKDQFGGWSIDEELFQYILKILPKGKTMVELGSGWASSQLSTYYNVYSIEHDAQWLGRYKTNYIFAPIRDGWYDVDILREKMPVDYELILIDGPPEKIGRIGFYKNLSLFHSDVSMIFDDVNRKSEFRLLELVSKALDRPYQIIKGQGKAFGVILGEKTIEPKGVYRASGASKRK